MISFDKETVQQHISLSLDHDPDRIPEEMKLTDSWVHWIPTPDYTKNKILKKPYPASNWSENPISFNLIPGRGIGFIYSDHHDYICLDVDSITPDSIALINQLNSYTEVSPSKKGVHVIFKCPEKSKLTQAHGNKRSTKIYDLYLASGFVTITGLAVSNLNSALKSQIRTSSDTPIQAFPYAMIQSILEHDFPNKVQPINKKALKEQEAKLSKSKVDIQFIRKALERIPVKALTADIFAKLQMGEEIIIDPYCEEEAREPWLIIGQAIHHNCDGGMEGYFAWKEWSARGNKFDEDALDAVWLSFSVETDQGAAPRQRPITIATLLKLIKTQELKFTDYDAKGYPLHTPSNVNTYLSAHRIEPYLNEITKNVHVTIPAGLKEEWGVPRQWDPDINTSATFIAAEWEKIKSRKAMSPVLVKNVLRARSAGNLVNPIRDYFTSLEWDGKDRMSELYETIIPCNYTHMDLYKAFIRKWMVQVAAAACHSTHHDVRLNRVLIFTGEQEIGKTKWVESLFPESIRHYCAADKVIKLGQFRTDNVKLTMELSSTLICNINEIDTMFQANAFSEFKAFLDQTTDTVVLPYGETPTRMTRRTVFIGSCNRRQFLRDLTGNRRFEVIECNKLDFKHSIDVDQLWAQVVYLYNSGEKWWLNEKESKARDSLNLSYVVAPSEDIQSMLDETFDAMAPQQTWKPYQLKDIRALLGIPPSTPRSQQTLQLKETLLLWLRKLPDTKLPKRQYPNNPNSPIIYFMPPLASNIPEQAFKAQMEDEAATMLAKAKQDPALLQKLKEMLKA